MSYNTRFGGQKHVDTGIKPQNNNHKDETNKDEQQAIQPSLNPVIEDGKEHKTEDQQPAANDDKVKKEDNMDCQGPSGLQGGRRRHGLLHHRAGPGAGQHEERAERHGADGFDQR